MTMYSRNIIDLYELIKNFVSDFPFAEDTKSRLDLDDFRPTDIDYTDLKVTHKPTKHITLSPQTATTTATITPNRLEHLPDDTSNITQDLMKPYSTNNTSAAQTDHLHTESHTNPACRLSIHKGITKEGSFILQIDPPNIALPASGGFQKEIQISKDYEQVIEEQLVSPLDTQIIVPDGHRTRADLVITEDEYAGRFQVETIYEGQISIKLRDKNDNSVITTMTISDLSTLFNSKYDFQPVPNQSNAVSFISEGICHCQFGKGQRVELHEEDN